MAKKPFIQFKFDGAVESAVKNAEKMAGKMITQISKETEANIRNLISTALAQGIPPYDAARAIVPLIGLTPQQGQAALKFREKLIDNGLPLTKVNEQVDRYADKLLNRRAEQIARTEIMDALNNGQNESWQQAQEQGFLSENATKEWIVTPDDALCPECEPMDGRTVPINEDFPNGDPPLHPSCRCTIAIGTP